MTENLPTEENLCRLAMALIEREGCTYAEAKDKLDRLRLHLVLGVDVIESPALQAALVTAINAGKRAFLGGVTVELGRDGPLLLRWSKARMLSEVIVDLGATLGTPPPCDLVQSICLGDSTSSSLDSLSIWVADWRGGVAPTNLQYHVPGNQDMPLAGVMAASLALDRGFIQITGLHTHFLDTPIGYSLWRPDLPFDHADATGPALAYLPKRLWLAGLGHLGQAYVWNLSLLPYLDPASTVMILQDFDRVVEGNKYAGLLCEHDSPGKMKTRLCAEWLEARGFQPRQVDRKFDDSLCLQQDEPRVALCGFDSLEPRRALEDAPFSLIVDCGIGGTHRYFDRISIHTFPDATKKPTDIWPFELDEQPINENLIQALGRKDQCGAVAETLARKQVATSFVGAFAGAFAVGEILRGLHGGLRCEVASFHLRSDHPPGVAMAVENYVIRASLAGSIEIR